MMLILWVTNNVNSIVMVILNMGGTSPLLFVRRFHRNTNSSLTVIVVTSPSGPLTLSPEMQNPYISQLWGGPLMKMTPILLHDDFRSHVVHLVSVRRFPSFRTQPLENLSQYLWKKRISEQPSPWRKSSKRKSCYGDRVYFFIFRVLCVCVCVFSLLLSFWSGFSLFGLICFRFGCYFLSEVV